MKIIFVSDYGLVAKVYGAIDHKKKPGIVLLSGSDGGLPGENAFRPNFIEMLVENGFCVMALAYFGVDTLSPTLVNIELEYFERAFQWMREQSFIDSKKIGVIGQSRGGELALLLGTIIPGIQAIVAITPPNTVMGGFPFPNKPAWLYKGKPIEPFVGGLTSRDEALTEADDLLKAMEQKQIPFHHNTQEDPCALSDLFEARAAMSNAPLGQIPVEIITAPLLLVSGGKDAIWPATKYCKDLVKRLDQKKTQCVYKHINYEDAGHGLLSSRPGGLWHPFGHFWCLLGGTVEGNQKAHIESVVEIVNFLSFLKNT